MSSDAMDYFSYALPPSISARQFLTQQYSVPSHEGVDYFYKPGSSARIEISGQSQNSFILPRTFRLCYSAVGLISTTDVAPDAITGLPFEGPFAVDQAPGAFLYGCPQISSIATELPSLTGNYSYLVSDTQSQKFYTQRLMCSGDEGGCELSGLKSTFKQTGRTWLAGGKSAVQRANGVTGSFWRRNMGSPVLPGDPALRDYALGSWITYQVPGSAFCSLMDGTSSCMPLAYIGSGSTQLNLQVNWAPVTSAMVVSQLVTPANAYDYLVTGVSVQWTAVNIIDSAILKMTEALFRGQVSMPVGGMNIPVPMTLSHRAFRLSSTTLPSPTGSVNLRVQAGFAACTAVMLKIDAVRPGVVSSNKHLLSIKPVLRNLTLQVGGAVFPARPISDIYVPQGTAPRGLSSSKYALAITTEADVGNAMIGGPTFVPTSEHIASEMYRESRGNFSLWDNDKYDSSPACELFAGCNGPSDLTSKTSARQEVTGAAEIIERYGYATGVGGAFGTTVGQAASNDSPNMFIFPLASFLPESSLRERGYQMAAVDLRNQSEVIISFEIVASAPVGVNLKNSDGVSWPEASAWDISAVMSYVECVTILPSRVNTSASSSLLPSAAGSVASGGGAAGI